MEFTTKTFDTTASPDDNSQGTVGVMPVIIRVDGQPFDTEASAKTQLSYYQNIGYLEGYRPVQFNGGFALMKDA